LAKWTSNPGKPENVFVEIFEKKKKAGQVLFQIEYQGPAVQNVTTLDHPSKLGY
jgi:hypothetical protein